MTFAIVFLTTIAFLMFANIVFICLPDFDKNNCTILHSNI